MPLLEETADLSSLGTGGRRDMSGNNAGTTTTSTSVPASVTVVPPSTAAAIEAAQNSGIIGTPQRRGNPGESESGLFGGNLPNKTLSTPTPPKPTVPIPTLGVNFFNDDDAKGFMTFASKYNSDIRFNDLGGPIREQSNWPDKAGSHPHRVLRGETQQVIFSQFNKASDKYSSSYPSSPMQTIDVIPPLFISNRGITQLFNNTDKSYPVGVPSRLESLHLSGPGTGVPLTTKNWPAGYTTAATNLDTYYSRLTNDTDILGLRNNSSNGQGVGFSKFGVGFGNKTTLQPIIVRDIGQRWGVERVEKPTLLATAAASIGNVEVAGLGKNTVKSYFNILDDIGKRILGREPTVFIDRYFSDIKRINGVTNALDALVFGSRFVTAQSTLQRQNPFEQITTTKYAISDDHQLTITPENFIPKSRLKFSHNFGDKTVAGVDLGKQTLDIGGMLPNSPLSQTAFEMNPRAYNPLSIFSLPGTLSINRNAYFDLSEVYNDGGIADYISHRAIDTATAATTKYIKSVALNAATAFGTAIKDNMADYAAKMYTKKQSSKLTEKLKKMSINDIGLSKLSISGLNIPSPDLGLGSIKSVKGPKLPKLRLGKISAAASKGISAAKKFAKDNFVPDKFNMPVSKQKANQLNIDLSDVGVDKVNLIPYGDENLENVDGSTTTYDQLDFIPFKFRDARNKEGGHMVFRAILSGITDTFTPDWSDERYVGRPDKVYVYQGTTREISFTFDVYPKSDSELVTLWEKLNYLAGQTYPHWSENMGMISPYTELTIGNMYEDAPGYISALTYTVQDNGTWETTFTSLPKYIQVNCSFVYIGKHLPSALQKHYDCPWIAPEIYVDGNPNTNTDGGAILASQLLHSTRVSGEGRTDGRLTQEGFKNILGSVGL